MYEFYSTDVANSEQLMHGRSFRFEFSETKTKSTDHNKTIQLQNHLGNEIQSYHPSSLQMMSEPNAEYPTREL